MDTESGFFLVSCQDVQPYLDGHKVLLSVGNPLATTYNGFRITARWGPRYSGAESDYKAQGEWAKSHKVGNFDFAQTLAPMRWNDVELVLAPSTVYEVGYILVSIETNEISLSKPDKK